MKRSEIERLLPAVIARTLRPRGPLAGLLDVMEGQHAPSEEVLKHLDESLNPRLTRDDFVPYLARWADLQWLLGDAKGVAAERASFPSGLGRLRELVAAAVRLSQWRGTPRGIVEFLEIATGCSGFEVVEEHEGRPFHIVVRAPSAAQDYRPMIERIVRMEKPAYATHAVEFAGTEET